MLHNPLIYNNFMWAITISHTQNMKLNESLFHEEFVRSVVEKYHKGVRNSKKLEGKWCMDKICKK